MGGGDRALSSGVLAAGEPPRVVWRSRGYLPHFDGASLIQHVTFHLADSLPREVVARLHAEVEALPEHERDAERRRHIDAWIDAGHGRCDLREPEVAEMVQGTLLFFDASRYHLLAWAVMPNHVHALLQPRPGFTLTGIVASWKKFTAARIASRRRTAPGNAALLSGSPIWHREYWDRYIRDQRHFLRAVEYIHQNPVAAGLIASAEAWRWSSAFRTG